ncbi:MAG: TRAP transporter small permease [Alphaproteobacteria bacterium]|nr:TRAP transporter small permease [Alphaproteobacteria bacterium]
MGPTLPEAGALAASAERGGEAREIVLTTQRHLKWQCFDILERLTMTLCGVCLCAFSTSVFFDVVTRTIGHPWLWLQEVTSTFFIYGIFIGAGVATRRNDHLYLTAITEAMHGRTRLVVETFNRIVILFAAFCMVWFGAINFWQGLGSFRMPSMTPISTLYGAIPLSGILVALFTIEQLVNGWRNGFEGPAAGTTHLPEAPAA